MASLVGIWAILVSIIGLNGFAAGVVGLLYVRRRNQRRAMRVLTAALVSGALPASVMLPVMVPLVGTGAESLVAMLFGAAVVFSVATAVSLPGALILARQLDRPGNEFRAFE